MEGRNLYTLRDEDGRMKAKFPEEVAQNLVLTVSGKWRPYTPKGGSAGRAYVVEEDCKVIVLMPTDSRGRRTPSFGDLFLWKGDLIIEPPKA